MSLEELDYKKVTIIDVREEYEFEMGCVEGSTNIPLGIVPDKIEEFKKIEGDIVLCCKSGGRSGQATMFLQQNGMTNVYNGGGWEAVVAQLAQ